MAAAKSAPVGLKVHAHNQRLASVRSKTGDSACSQAMSDWKTKGMSGSVAAILGKCRAKAHALRLGSLQRAAGNEAKAQVLEHRAATGKVGVKARMEMAKQKRAERETKLQVAPGIRKVKGGFVVTHGENKHFTSKREDAHGLRGMLERGAQRAAKSKPQIRATPAIAPQSVRPTLRQQAELHRKKKGRGSRLVQTQRLEVAKQQLEFQRSQRAAKAKAVDAPRPTLAPGRGTVERIARARELREDRDLALPRTTGFGPYGEGGGYPLRGKPGAQKQANRASALTVEGQLNPTSAEYRAKARQEYQKLMASAAIRAGWPAPKTKAVQPARRPTPYAQGRSELAAKIREARANPPSRLAPDVAKRRLKEGVKAGKQELSGLRGSPERRDIAAAIRESRASGPLGRGKGAVDRVSHKLDVISRSDATSAKAARAKADRARIEDAKRRVPIAAGPSGTLTPKTVRDIHRAGVRTVGKVLAEYRAKRAKRRAPAMAMAH